MPSQLQTIRSGGTEHPEDIVNFMMSRLVTVSGIFNLSASHFKVAQESSPAMSVKVTQGYGFIVKSDLSMVYPISLNTADGSVAISANSSGSTRIDAVVVYIDLGASANAAVTNVAKFLVVQGTTSAPSAATIQAAVGASNPYLLLAYVSVTSGAVSIVTADITDKRVQYQMNDLASSKGAFLYSNAIINGGCVVAQRVTAPNISTSEQYGSVDRFKVKATGTLVSAGTIAQTAAANIGTSLFALKIAGLTVTGTGIVYVKYRMESKDAKQFKSKEASFGVKVYHDVGSAVNYTITVRKANAADDFSAVTDIANSGQISVATATATQLAFPSINSGNLGDCSNGLEIEIKIECGAVTTKNFELTEFQFNLGGQPFTFQPKSFVDELLACMRYYEKTYDYTVAPATNTAAGLHETNILALSTTNNTEWYLGNHPKFKVPKRTTSYTVTFYRLNGTSGSWYIESADRAVGVINTGQTGFSVTNATGGSITPTAGYAYGHYTCDADF